MACSRRVGTIAVDMISIRGIWIFCFFLFSNTKK